MFSLDYPEFLKLSKAQWGIYVEIKEGEVQRGSRQMYEVTLTYTVISFGNRDVLIGTYKSKW